MLIKMIDGGMINYSDDTSYISGCPTCDYGSEYINEIRIDLIKYKIFVKLNQMYDFALSEGEIIKLFLSNYNEIQGLTEKEFIDWIKQKLYEIVQGNGDVIERFDVTEVT